MTMKKPNVPRTARRWACTGLALAMLAAHPLHAQQAPRRNQEMVTLNFVNADIEAVTRAIGAMLERPLLVDPRVTASMSAFTKFSVTISC